MKAIGYPKLVQHRELHNGLIGGLNNLIEKPINTNIGLEGLKKFVYSWIIDHILNHDKKYFEFYREHIFTSTPPKKRGRGRPKKYQ
jgi:hemerythrin